MRFTVLHHRVPTATAPQVTAAPALSAQATVARGDHFDWLFERSSGGEKLWTFATPVIELVSADAIPMTRLPDHRRLYLDYEGPVSNDRGVVTQVASGTHRVHRAGLPPQSGADELSFQTTVSFQQPGSSAEIRITRCFELLFQPASKQSIHWYSDKESSERVRNTAGVVWDGFLTIQR
ncbi:MAG: hypothetical protein ACF8AM_13475 [Rhodopirellula sp. JB055]|uniref:hypothetical protein n=1 Tax=Rhodopirellula sp. JB055 TaxID=3342846 RepID=UPI00370A5236